MNKLAVILLFGTIAIAKVSAQTTIPSNTISSTDYIGSANNIDVLFKRNNIEAGKITPTSVSLGVNTGLSLGTFEGNTFIGAGSGKNSSGGYNSYFGGSSGYSQIGSGNISIGGAAGSEANGNQNIFIGTQAGENTPGSGNICLGFLAGSSIYGTNNKLWISSPIYEDNGPLIWGDFDQTQLKLNGKVGVGYGFGTYPSTVGSVDVSSYNLFVKGGILTEEVRVSNTWADYVFSKDYKLPTLQDVEKHILEKGHLINVPSAKEVAENGIELGDMAKVQQEKIEELTLYIIDQNKMNQKQSVVLEKQSKEIEELRIAVKTLLENKR